MFSFFETKISVDDKHHHIQFVNVNFTNNVGVVLHGEYRNQSQTSILFANCNWSRNTLSSLVTLDTFTTDTCAISRDWSVSQLIFEKNNFKDNTFDDSAINIHCFRARFSDAIFENNYGVKTFGVSSSECLVNLSNVNFINNVGGAFGAIFDHNDNGLASQYVLEDIVFLNNTVNGSGAGLSFVYENKKGDTEMNKKGPMIRGLNVQCIGNTVANYGGCIFISGELMLVSQQIALQNILCDGNFADQGGCIWTQHVSLDIEGINGTNNSAQTLGAVIVALSHQCSQDYFSVNEWFTLSVTKARFMSNIVDAANEVGGDGGSLVTGCYNLHIDTATFQLNTAQRRGGSILAHQTCLDLVNVDFYDNAALIGAGLAISSMPTSNASCFNVINNAVFKRNLAENGGGAIHINNMFNIDEASEIFAQKDYLSQDLSEFIINNSTFSKNMAPNFGSAIAVSRHWGYKNDIKLDEVDDENPNDNPAMMEIVIEKVTFVDNNIINIATATTTKGGAAFTWFIEKSSESHVNIINSTFNSNVVNSSIVDSNYGGAIWMTCWDCFRARLEEDIALRIGDIDNCHCIESNGYSLNAVLNIDECSFTENEALVGGAVSTSCGTIIIDNSSFDRNNKLSVQPNDRYSVGGAVSLRSLTKIFSSSFINNYATYGGALYLSCSNASTLSDQITIKNNIAHIGGGAYFFQISHFSINDIEWINNVAHIGGAALNFNVKNTERDLFGTLDNHLFNDNLSPFAPTVWINDNTHAMLLFNERDDKYSIKININHTENAATNKQPFSLNDVNIDNLMIDYGDINVFYLRLFISPKSERIYSKAFRWNDDDIALQLCGDNQCRSSTKISQLNQDFTFSELLIFDKKDAVVEDLQLSSQYNLEINASSFFDSLEYSSVFKSSQIFDVNFTMYGVIKSNDLSIDTENIEASLTVNITNISISNSNALQNVTIPGETQEIEKEEIMGFGGVYVDVKYCFVNIEISDSNWNNNTAAVGSVLSFFAPDSNSSSSSNSIICKNCTFNNNVAAISSPIIAAAFVNVFLINNNIYNSESFGDSSVLYAIHSFVEIYASDISDNICLTNGGIFLQHSKYKMVDTQCTNNVAQYGRGACLYVMDISRFVMFKTPKIIQSTDILQIDQSHFENNNAGKGGAALYINTDYDLDELSTYNPTTSTVTSRRRQLLQFVTNETNTRNKSDIIGVKIVYDFHRDDIFWNITSVDGTIEFAHGDFMGNESIRIQNEECIKFTIYDEFGDGLNNGEGTWILSWNDYNFYSPSRGQFASSETLIICDPQLWNNTNVENITFTVSLQQRASFKFLKVYESIIKDKFLNRLNPKLMFTNSNVTKLRLNVIRCLFKYPHLSTTFSWPDFWNNKSMESAHGIDDIISECPLSMTDDIVINTSATDTPSINSMLIEDIDTLYDHITNINMSVCNLRYLHNTSMIDTLCEIFNASVFKPPICQTESCPLSMVCDTNNININYKSEDIFYSFRSKPYVFQSHDVPFFPLHSRPLSKISLFGQYPFTTCASSADIDLTKRNISDTISVVVTSPTCGDDVAFMNKLEEEGVRAVIVYNSNYTNQNKTTSKPNPSFLRNILMIKCLITTRIQTASNINITTMSNELERTIAELLNATDVSAANVLQTETESFVEYEYEIIVDISDQIEGTYTNLDSSTYLKIFSKACKAKMKKSLRNQIAELMIYGVIETTDLPTESPTISPTFAPTLAPTAVVLNIPIREINSNYDASNQFMETLFEYNTDAINASIVHVVDTNISLSFDCSDILNTKSPTTLEPTLSPTIMPSTTPTASPVAGNETVDNTVLIYFFDENKEFMFQWLLSELSKNTDSDTMEYVYDFCGWDADYSRDSTSNMVVDSLSLETQFICIKYKGKVLQLKEEMNSTSTSFDALLMESDDNDCSKESETSLLDLTPTQNDTIVNWNEIGTYCSKLISLSGNQFEIKYKKLYSFTEPMITITNTYFTNNFGEHGDGGAVKVLSEETNVNDYITMSIADSYFTNNYVGGNNSGGAVHRAFGLLPTADDGYNYMANLDLFGVEWVHNEAAYGGALALEQILTDDGNIFKSLTRIINNLFERNSAAYGAALFTNGSNIFIANTEFINNTASHSGGALYINSSGLTISNVNITDNVAAWEGGGIFNKEYPRNIYLQICLGFYDINFNGNNATESRGGAFYLNIVGEDEDSQQKSDCLKVVNNEFSSNNDINGNQVFLNLTEGVLAPFIREEWCSDDPAICQAFTTSLAYLCMQQDSIEDGVCDTLQKVLNDAAVRVINNETVTPSAYIAHEFAKNTDEWIKYQPVLFLNPGASVILEIYGWDNFGNPISTDRYDVELNDTNPVIFTSKANKFDRSAWVLPLFVDKGSVGQKGKGALVDPSNVVNILPFATVQVVPCDNGSYQQPDPNDDELFTCTECIYFTYTMNTMQCNPCEIGMKCMGKNQTYIKSGYYGVENEDGTISTQRCPEGYCCAHPLSYPGITSGCLFDPFNRTNTMDPHLLCGNATNRNWFTPLCGDCLPGFSETSSKTGQCLICKDSSGFWNVLLPNIAGLALIAFYMKKGLQPQPIDAPFIVYTTKSALYVFQLLPYLTFQSTVGVIAPIAEFFSLSVDMFGGSSANCILKDMTGRTKVALGILPGACYAFQLFTVWLIITIWKSYKVKQAFDAKADREEQELEEELKQTQQLQSAAGENEKEEEKEEEKTKQEQQVKNGMLVDQKWDHALTHTVWNIVLMVYTQVTSTLVKLIDCRPLGPKNVMFYQGSVNCYDWIHVICFVFLFCCFLFPFVVILILFRTRRMYGMGYLRRSYPTLVLNYRKDCWWYSGINLFRRFLIIFIASLPAERSDVTSTFLAIIVGAIFGYHLFLQPMHFRVNNYGETYVWFIALCICTLNIIDFDNIPTQATHLKILMMILVFALFVPMPLLFVPFFKEKVPFTFHWDKIQPDEEKNADADSDEEKEEEKEEEEKEEEKKETDEKKEEEDDDEDKKPEIFKQFQFGGGYQLTLKRKIKTEQKIIEFDKEHFEAQKKLKQKKADPIDAVEQELNEWLFGENENVHGSNENSKDFNIQSDEISVSSEEKEIHKKQILDEIVNEQLSNEDVSIFSADELDEIVQRDEIEHTPVINGDNHHKVLTDAWNDNNMQ